MSITSELVDKYDLFREGLAQDLSQIRKCVIEFFGGNNSELKRLNVKVFGDFLEQIAFRHVFLENVRRRVPTENLIHRIRAFQFLNADKLSTR